MTASGDLSSSAPGAVSAALGDPVVGPTLRELDKSLHAFDLLPRSLAGDDEVLNWAHAEAVDHLRAAWWCMLGGSHPSAILAIHRALEVGLATVAWQLEPDSTLRPTFAEWEAGRSTPTASEMAAWLEQHPSVVALRRNSGIDLAGHVREVEVALLDSRRLHHFRNGWGVLQLSAEGVSVVAEAMREVIGTLGAAWWTLHPDLAHRASKEEVQRVFVHSWPASVLAASRAGSS